MASDTLLTIIMGKMGPDKSRVMCHTSNVTRHTSQASHIILPSPTPHAHTTHTARLITEDFFSEQHVARHHGTDDRWREHERTAVALVETAGDNAPFGAWENEIVEVNEMRLDTAGSDVRFNMSARRS
jgi:hypothetical protein